LSFARIWRRERCISLVHVKYASICAAVSDNTPHNDV
jgi:hypothetical protein